MNLNNLTDIEPATNGSTEASAANNTIPEVPPIPLDTRVETTLRGSIVAYETGEMCMQAENVGFIWFPPGYAGFKPLPAAHRPLKPGQVWSTPDGLYFVRVSRQDLPYRLTPADLSNESGLKTLPEDAFFVKYPNAQLMFSPGPGRKRRSQGTHANPASLHDSKSHHHGTHNTQRITSQTMT